MTRVYHEWMKLADRPPEPDWDLIERLDEFAQECTTDAPEPLYRATVPGADIPADTLDELKAEIAHEPEVAKVWIGWGHPTDGLRIVFTFFKDWETGVSIEGPEQAEVVGITEVIRRNAERWSTLPRVAPDNEESTPVAPLVNVEARPPAWRRALNHPWAVQVVGGVIATVLGGAIVWLLWG